jgi:hypothetical protein
MRARFPRIPRVPTFAIPDTAEPRWPVTLVAILVIVMQLFLPGHLALKSQPYVSGLEAVLAFALFIVNPGKIKDHRPERWFLGIALTSVMTFSNIASVVHLIHSLIDGKINSANGLLAYGGSIWITNVIVFALWYWEFDRGGPGARAQGLDPYPDFLFPQLVDRQFAPEKWSPNFFDYLYISFTNASAFSPTDVLPLTRWAKMLMLIQSTTSLITVGLVIARAVNILK